MIDDGEKKTPKAIKEMKNPKTHDRSASKAKASNIAAELLKAKGAPERA